MKRLLWILKWPSTLGSARRTLRRGVWEAPRLRFATLGMYGRGDGRSRARFPFPREVGFRSWHGSARSEFVLSDAGTPRLNACRPGLDRERRHCRGTEARRRARSMR